MAFAIGKYVAIGPAREAFQIYAGTGVVGDLWRARAVGGVDSSTLTFLNTDTAGVFETAFALNPPGFSPFGDLVTFRSNILLADTINAAQDLLAAGPAQEGIVFTWVVFTVAPTEKFAIVALPAVGGTDRFVFVYVGELSLAQKNPAFP